MRLLIAAGGTGGHIYPALAVARSLSASPERARAALAGRPPGPRGDARPGGRHPAAPLAARSLRTTEADVHAVLDPIRLGVSVPQATAILLAERPAAIFTTGGYVAVPVLMAAAPLGIPVVMWDGNVIPGGAVRATARWPRARGVVRGDVPGAGGGRAGPPVLRDRDADPRHRRDRPRRGARADGRRAGRAGPADLRWLAGGPRFNAAVAERLPAWSSGSRSSTSPARTATRRRWPARGPARRPAPRYRPYPFLRDEMLAALAPPTSSSGGPGRRRWPR
jgi:hypothetical protein